MGHFNIGHKRGQYYIGARIGYCSSGGLCTWCYIAVDNVAVHTAQQAIVQFYNKRYRFNGFILQIENS